MMHFLGRLIFMVFLGAVMAALIILGMRYLDTAPSRLSAIADQRFPRVTVMKVDEPDNIFYLSGQGVLDYDEDVNLRAPVSGRVQQILVQAGFPVEKGKPVLRLDDSALQKRYEALQLKMAALQAKNPLSSSPDLTLDSTTESLSSSQMPALNNTSETPPKKTLSNLAAKREEKPSKEESKPATPKPMDGLGQLMAAMNTLESQMAQRQVKISRTAKITKILVNEGDTVEAGQPLMTLSPAGAPIITIMLPVRELLKIDPHLPQKVIIRNMSETEETEGKVIAVQNDTLPEAKTGWVKVQPDFQNESWLKPGAKLRVKIPIESQGLISVVDSAVFHQGKDCYVFVVEKNGPKTVAWKRPVEVADISGQQVQLKNGLGASEVIVIHGGNRLHDQQQVVIIGLNPFANSP